mmetsp:Transcript_49122/g.96306  ORF Transcript_49122/g.96306 Transcript_49122/m.96306 type:complete len:94 (+) Transcript_49122:29-310(+)
MEDGELVVAIALSFVAFFLGLLFFVVRYKRSQLAQETRTQTSKVEGSEAVRSAALMQEALNPVAQGSSNKDEEEAKHQQGGGGERWQYGSDSD